jgi:hypothetical protein
VNFAELVVATHRAHAHIYYSKVMYEEPFLSESEEVAAAAIAEHGILLRVHRVDEYDRKREESFLARISS